MFNPLQSRNADRAIQIESARRHIDSLPGFTLIELVGVLAVMAILATIILSITVKQLDRVASDRESAQLRIIGEAVKSSVLRNRYIPGTNNWVQKIAMEMGVDDGSVSANSRRLPRYLIIDPALQVGGKTAAQVAAAGYSQTNNSSIAAPVNTRLMILTSLGIPLPAGIANGVAASTNDFNGMWDAFEGSLPSGSAWTGWKGASDLKIQRVNLAATFVHLLLVNTPTNLASKYAITTSTGAFQTNTVPNPDGVDSYFFQGSVLRLISTANPPIVDQILTEDISFVCTTNGWGGDIYTNPPVTATAMEIMVSKFLTSPGNPGAGEVDMTYYPGLSGNALQDIQANQQWLADNYRLFMQIYIDWANSDFTDNTLKDQLSKVATQMKSFADKLDNGIQEGVVTP